jgi:hypothetical protein
MITVEWAKVRRHWALWRKVQRAHGWRSSWLQVWVRRDGSISDSVTYRLPGLRGTIYVSDTTNRRIKVRLRYRKGA